MKSRLVPIAVLVLVIGIVLWLSKAPERPPATVHSSSEAIRPEAQPSQHVPATVPAPPKAPAAEPGTVPTTEPTATSPQTALPAGASPASVTPPMPSAAVGTTPPTSPAEAEIGPEQITQDLDQVSLSLRDYRTLMAQNPVGTNSEITKALMGGNPKGAQLAPEGVRLNGSGEMVDRWGTPYFFHQMSATSMEIHSAGPDKQMGTDDDIVLR